MTMRTLLFILIANLLLACTSGPAPEHAGHQQYYSCSMHPEVMRTAPGDCPICGMSLTPVSLGSHTMGPGEIMLTDQQIKLGNITTDTVRMRTIGDELILAGAVAVDREASSTISSRVMGRVDRLYHKTPGDRIHRGQPLYAIYSEDLQTAIAELQIAHRTAAGTMQAPLVQSARMRLQAFGLSEDRITGLERMAEVPLLIDIPSPVDGSLISLRISEGDRVMEGDGLMDIVALDRLWVEAQVHPTDLPRIKGHPEAGVTIPALPDVNIRSAISFINPERVQGTAINLVRLAILNTDGRLQPGMQAVVSVPMDAREALVLPIDAVLRDAQGASVWLSTGNNTFKNVMVTTGVENDRSVEIISGLQAGDRVVITGAYLVNSEYIFKQGADPMAGMDM